MLKKVKIVNCEKKDRELTVTIRTLSEKICIFTIW